MQPPQREDTTPGKRLVHDPTWAGSQRGSRGEPDEQFVARQGHDRHFLETQFLEPGPDGCGHLGHLPGIDAPLDDRKQRNDHLSRTLGVHGPGGTLLTAACGQQEDRPGETTEKRSE